ncbi:hypothetical protein ACOSP7_014690 [Xanthoceras sorbifolium]
MSTSLWKGLYLYISMHVLFNELEFLYTLLFSPPLSDHTYISSSIPLATMSRIFINSSSYADPTKPTSSNSVPVSSAPGAPISSAPVAPPLPIRNHQSENNMTIRSKASVFKPKLYTIVTQS